MLRKFTEVPLDSESSMKDHENEFEKFYFISMVSSFSIRCLMRNVHGFIEFFTVCRNTWQKDAIWMKPQ